MAFALIGVPLALVVSRSLALLKKRRVEGRSVPRRFFHLPGILLLVAVGLLWAWSAAPTHTLLSAALTFLLGYLGVFVVIGLPVTVVASLWSVVPGRCRTKGSPSTQGIHCILLSLAALAAAALLVGWRIVPSQAGATLSLTLVVRYLLPVLFVGIGIGLAMSSWQAARQRTDAEEAPARWTFFRGPVVLAVGALLFGASLLALASPVLKGLLASAGDWAAVRPFLHQHVSIPVPVLWLQSEDTSKLSLILMGLWGAGAGMIIWLAGLKGIPRELYEAAEIDGAGVLSRFRHITLPMLSPYIFFNLVMGVIGAFQVFTNAYIMTNGEGGPVDATLFYVFALFNHAFRYFRMGYASALAWVLFVIILILTMINWRLRKVWVFTERGDV
jgi:ABC-type sugar transport system permease subunit